MRQSENLDPLSWDDFRELSHRVLDELIEWQRTLRDRPVWQPVPESVREALERARPFAREQLGVDPVVATCTSWLLDPWWGRVLGEESNIVRFQRRFTLVGEGAPGEGDVFRFVFGMPRVDAGRAPRRTRLERAALERLESGEGLRVCTGWLRLP